MSYTIYRLTPEKYEEIVAELNRLSNDERQRIADQLDWTRDLANKLDDSAYLDVREEKEFLEKRINELKFILHNCEVMNEVSINGIDQPISLGSKVRVEFNKFQDEYRIVSVLEADPFNKKISDQSPLGRALIGAKMGDLVQVITESAEQQYKVLAVT
jgi:transcription elongation factor GreA